MPSTRRRFLIGSTATITLLSGCSYFGEDSATIAQLEVELANGTSDHQMFHYAVETSKGVDDWESHEVEPQTREPVIRETPGDFDPIGIHGVVDDRPTSGELIGIGGAETGEICLRILFEYGVLGEDPSFLESSNIRCE